MAPLLPVKPLAELQALNTPLLVNSHITEMDKLTSTWPTHTHKQFIHNQLVNHNVQNKTSQVHYDYIQKYMYGQLEMR